MDNRLPIPLSRRKLIAAGLHSFAAILPVQILHSLLTSPGGYPLAYAIHGGVAAIALAIFIHGRRSIAPEDDRRAAAQAVTTRLA